MTVPGLREIGKLLVKDEIRSNYSTVGREITNKFTPFPVNKAVLDTD